MILHFYNKIRQAELEFDENAHNELKMKDESTRKVMRKESIRKVELEINKLNKTPKPT